MCVYQRFHPYNVEFIPAHVARTAYLQYGLTALTLASANGHLAVVKALVAAGADVNAASEVLSGGDVGISGEAHVALFFAGWTYGTRVGIHQRPPGGGGCAGSCRG
jgi:hypothetical protein